MGGKNDDPVKNKETDPCLGGGERFKKKKKFEKSGLEKRSRRMGVNQKGDTRGTDRKKGRE